MSDKEENDGKANVESSFVIVTSAKYLSYGNDQLTVRKSYIIFYEKYGTV